MGQRGRRRAGRSSDGPGPPRLRPTVRQLPGAEQGRAAVRPHHEPALTPPPAQPVEGVAAEREGGGGVDVGPHQVGPDDRDRGDPGRCPPGARVDDVCSAVRQPEVATAPLRTGTTATTRAGSCGCSTPIRQPGLPAIAVRQTRSPPAERQTSVSASPSKAAGRAIHGPPLHHTTRVEDGPPARVGASYVEGATGLLTGELAQREDLTHLRRGTPRRELAAGQPGDHRVVRGRC